MEIRFHKRVRGDLKQILKSYDAISDVLGDDFYAEFQAGVSLVVSNPRYFHFDSSGLRRFNLERFPYHFLYDIPDHAIRVWVLRHDHREPGFGLRRFNH